jgi:hypothetical protein
MRFEILDGVSDRASSISRSRICWTWALTEKNIKLRAMGWLRPKSGYFLAAGFREVCFRRISMQLAYELVGEQKLASDGNLRR